MISAKEARQIAESANGKDIQEEIKNAEENIMSATNYGLCNCELDFHISGQTEKYLKKLGYKVSYSDPQIFGRECTFINW